jgi:alkylhydroperoxidase/carboxymuconolactone decarboxylase family protein YurZ
VVTLRGTGVYPNLRKRLNFLHPVLENVILQHAYGRTLSRPGPSLRLRELCVIAVLAGQNVLPQLVGFYLV